MDLLAIFRRAPKQAKRKLAGWRSRNWKGAKSDRMTSDWVTSSESINIKLEQSLVPLRARSRDQYLNNDFVRRFVSMVKINVVGARGVVLQARSIGVRGDLDTTANQAIETAFADWGRRENCDLRGRCTWIELQHMAVVSAAIDGEILARHVMGTSQGGKYGYRIQMLDPEQLESSYAGTYRGNPIRMGIETDSAGRAVAYHLRTPTPGDGTYVTAAGVRYERVLAEDIIHAFVPDHVAQLRGYPWTSAALWRLKQLDAYFEAAITNARAGASKMGFITTPDGDSYTGDGEDGSGNKLTDFEAGVIEELPAGFTFQGWDPKYPHEQFDSFTKTFVRAIGGSLALGVSYPTLTGDLEGASYSSMRGGVLEEREAWKLIQEWFIGVFCQPVYDRWLGCALLATKIMPEPTPESPNPLPLKVTRRDAYHRVSWQPRRWPWVDPQNDANANILLVENCMTTVSAVIRETGKDPDDVFEERAKEKALMKKLGLTDRDVIGEPSGNLAGV